MNAKKTLDKTDDIVSRKRSRRSASTRECDIESQTSDEQQDTSNCFDPKLFEKIIPEELKAVLASAIFEIGLKNASPKILMPLMPSDTTLSTEHIKSHLQKYRIHYQRSKDEFESFYETHFKKQFAEWESRRGWQCGSIDNVSVPSSSSSPYYEKNRIANNKSVDKLTESTHVNSVADHHSCLSKVRSISSSSTCCDPSQLELIKRAKSMIDEWRNMHRSTELIRNSSIAPT